MKNTKSIASYVLAGLERENHELFMARIELLLSNKLDMMVTGIPVMAIVTDCDNRFLLELCQKQHCLRNVNRFEIQDARIEFTSDDWYLRVNFIEYNDTEERNNWLRFSNGSENLNRLIAENAIDIKFL